MQLHSQVMPYSQPAHGFQPGHFITPSPNGWTRATPDALSFGLVTVVPNSYQFDAVHYGPAVLRGHGFGPGGTPVYLSQTTPGSATSSALVLGEPVPTSGVVQIVAVVLDDDNLFVLPASAQVL